MPIIPCIEYRDRLSVNARILAGIYLGEHGVKSFHDVSHRKMACDFLSPRIGVPDRKVPSVWRDGVGHVNEGLCVEMVSEGFERVNYFTEGNINRIESDSSMRVAMF